MPARERYKGSYWTTKRRYGEQVSDGWKILSAEYGILDPEEKIVYYEQVPENLRGVPVETDARLPNGLKAQTELDLWAVDVYEGLSQWLQSSVGRSEPHDVELETLVGKKYRDPLVKRDVFDALSDSIDIPGELTVIFPFQDVPAAQGGMFQQISWMSDCIEVANENDDSLPDRSE
jgi:hypothetical protein